MAYEMPLDVDYFDHPKALRLAATLKNPEAAIFPIRLWAWAAKYARAGTLPQDVASVEEALRWKGAPGILHAALVDAGFVDKDGITIHDWHEYTGRSIALYEAKKAKKREKYDRGHGVSSKFVPEQPKYKPGTNVPTLLTQGDEAPSNATAVCAQLVALWNEAQQTSVKVTPKRLIKVKARLKDGFTEEQLADVVAKLTKSPWHNGENQSQWKAPGPEWVLNTHERVEEWLNKTLESLAVKEKAPW